jgi:hypothetical protein
MTNTVNVTVLLHNATQPERTESYPKYRGNMVTPTGLHGVTATPSKDPQHQKFTSTGRTYYHVCDHSRCKLSMLGDTIRGRYRTGEELRSFGGVWLVCHSSAVPTHTKCTHPSRPAHTASYTIGAGSFPGIKRPAGA